MSKWVVLLHMTISRNSGSSNETYIAILVQYDPVFDFSLKSACHTCDR